MSSHTLPTENDAEPRRYSQETYGSQISPKGEQHYAPWVDEGTDEQKSPIQEKAESPKSRQESSATTMKNSHGRKDSDSIDRIETVQPGEMDTLDDHSRNLAETVKHATGSAKRRIYLHHRAKKELTKQFTPRTAPAHLQPPKPNADEEKANHVHEDQVLQSSFGQNLLVMVTTFPYWNMAFWSGWCYSIGSAMFIIDGLWSWIPLQWPGHEFKNQEKYGVPLMFFFGACLYQIGGVMAYLEAINDGCFAGAAIKRLLNGHQDLERELLDAKLHTFFGHIIPHHHHDDEDKNDDRNESQDPEAGWRTLTETHSSGQELYDEVKERVERRGGIDEGPAEEGKAREYLTWRYWPTWHALWSYHIFELGYIACTIQLFGVTLYGITSVVILPGIFDSLVWWQKLAAYWVPEIVASCCFLIASIMFTIMAQDKWYKPEIGAVSWWIGIWAQVGSVGFLLCAIFGSISNHHTWASYQSSLSSTWGSLFYMLSGLFQWYEAINVNVGPVLAFPNNRTPILLRKQKA